jgi:hypothetical protein
LPHTSQTAAMTRSMVAGGLERTGQVKEYVNVTRTSSVRDFLVPEFRS